MAHADRIRILADDLTGALDTAAAFSGEVPVFIDTPPAVDSPYRHAPVSVVMTPTRDVPSDTLPSALAPTLDWFTSGTLAYKKVDSLLRGNTFAEIAWLQAHGHFAGTIFAPAFPAQSRITADNRQWIARPGEARQPVASPLRETFATFGLNAGPVFDSAAPPSVWIPDVLDDDELDRIARRLDDPTLPAYLWCGSAGLGQAIARRRGLVPQATTATLAARRAGPIVLISASFQPVLYAQWEMLKTAMLKAAMPTPAIAERARQDEMTRALEQTRNGAPQAWFDLSPRRDMTQEESLALLQRNLGQLVAGLPAPGQVMIVGGDTLLGLCRATGAEALLGGASIRNGWGCATLVGGRWNGVRCHSRSGAFGGPDDLIEMMRLLTANGHGSSITEKGN